MSGKIRYLSYPALFPQSGCEKWCEVLPQNNYYTVKTGVQIFKYNIVLINIRKRIYA